MLAWAAAPAVAIVLCAGGIGVSMALTPGEAAIRRELSDAARAPFLALARNDARALCAAFTPSAARYLARRERGADCTARVHALLGASELSHEERWRTMTHAIRLKDVQLYRDSATATMTGAKVVKMQLGFRKAHGTWRIATDPLLAVANICMRAGPQTSCPPSSRQVLFGFVGLALGDSPLVSPPAAVRRAGGRELREFRTGARVAADAGCLACHRIGAEGNPRPGPALTHVGAHLSRSQIERVLRHPSEPMPSFKNLPKSKFRALARFLALLR
jgi:hypothetical protein